jgi:molybdopterin synthase sulfur carrier subunit
MARVVFTSNLLRHVACPDSEVPADTLRGALQAVFDANPRVRDYVLDEQGELRKHVMVFIDGRRVRDRQRLSDPVRPSSEIFVLQALTGG